LPPALLRYHANIHGAGLLGALAISQLDWLIIEKPEKELLNSLSILLDPGEAEAIALAMNLPESTVLLDDAQAQSATGRMA
jgi:predicted nucleic acid-binding protein